MALPALPASPEPACLTGLPPSSSFDGSVAEGGTGAPVKGKPTPSSVGMKGLSSGVLGVRTLVGATGSDRGGQSGAGAASEGAVVISNRAAEGSDSVDWEAVRLAPSSKVETHR